jgi:2-oxoglutarate dehydrogenase E2 component (dihydrolipoamide succinyltransferase)
MTELRVPRVNPNDVSYTLLEWLCGQGAPMRQGDPVVVVETSKAVQELTCPADGYLCQLVEIGAECAVGQIIGRVFASAEECAQYAVPGPPAAPVAPAPIVITGPARELMREFDVGEEVVAALGRRIIRREDVRPLIDAPVPAAADAPGLPVALAATARTERLSRAQRAVGAVVTRSHREVPAAFVAVKVGVDGALACARSLGRRERCLVGLPELLLKAVAAQVQTFPRCFAALLDDGRLAMPEAAAVGVTIDVGRGLQVPVVRDAGALSWRDVASAMMGFRMTALRATFRADDLVGANIVIALHHDLDVTFAIPIVFPGQVCAVSLGAVQPELELGPDGGVSSRRVVQIGVAYDHRVINGRDAVIFLAAVKDLLEAPDALVSLG